MPSPTSLVTRLGFAAQTVQGTYVTTNVQLARAASVESLINFDLIENLNHMIGVHERSSARQSVAERSSVSVPFSAEIPVYPRSLPYLLFGIGFVPGTAVTVTGISTHKFVKSNVGDAPYVTAYLRMGAGAGKFTRQIRDMRFSQLALTMNRQGVVARVDGMGLDERVVQEGDYTTVAEVDTQFLPFLGGMVWDITTYGDVNFGIPREHVITFDREIEEDDQLLHEYARNDNQEMSFRVSGVMRGLEFDMALYNALVYGDLGSIYNASPSAVTVLTGLTLELNTSRNIPAGTPASPYKFIINIPKAQINLTGFRAAGNEIVRAEATWEAVDDATTPPVRIELTNNVTTYPYNNTLFTAAGGSAWTLPDATP